MVHGALCSSTCQFTRHLRQPRVQVIANSDSAPPRPSYLLKLLPIARNATFKHSVRDLLCLAPSVGNHSTLTVVLATLALGILPNLSASRKQATGRGSYLGLLDGAFFDDLFYTLFVIVRAKLVLERRVARRIHDTLGAVPGDVSDSGQRRETPEHYAASNAKSVAQNRLETPP